MYIVSKPLIAGCRQQQQRKMHMKWSLTYIKKGRVALECVRRDYV